MKFVKEGKAYQLVIENGQDLKDALTLDEALWVAMSAPLKAFVCDPKFLDYVNTNKSGHISSEEVKAAIRWLLDVYPKKDLITAKFGGSLRLADLNADMQAELARIRAPARRTLCIENEMQIAFVIQHCTVPCHFQPLIE